MPVTLSLIAKNQAFCYDMPLALTARQHKIFNTDLIFKVSMMIQFQLLSIHVDMLHPF